MITRVGQVREDGWRVPYWLILLEVVMVNLYFRLKKKRDYDLFPGNFEKIVNTNFLIDKSSTQLIFSAAKKILNDSYSGFWLFSPMSMVWGFWKKKKKKKGFGYEDYLETANKKIRFWIFCDPAVWRHYWVSNFFLNFQ